MTPNLNKKWINKRPANCTRLHVPKVNPEIWANLSHWTKSADLRLANFHKTPTKAGNALTYMTDSLLGLRTALGSSVTEQTKTLNQLVSCNADALALLGNLHIDLSLRRRELIKPHLKRDYGALCSTRTPITEFLFGDDLQGQLSSITASNKMRQTTSVFDNAATSRRFPDSHKGKMAPHHGDKSFLWERKGRAYRPYQNKNKHTPRFQGKQKH